MKTPASLLRLTAAASCLALLSPVATTAQTRKMEDPLAVRPSYPTLDGRASRTPSAGGVYERLRRLMSDKQKVRRKAARALGKTDPATLIPLVDAYFFSPSKARADVRSVLEELSGEQFGDRYRDWFVYVGGRQDIEPPRGYVAWKGELFSRIDPVYQRILSPEAEATVRLRLREVQWGGVPLDGIPAVDDPVSVPADTASFMRDTDTVFGVELGGERRAYPVKVLGWHELLNDTVGGQPITLSFCTLCGSGILYSAVDEHGVRLKFGTSGLLYRSNKLMFDRATLSLWSNLTGEAVVGERAAGGATLTMLPMTLTRWNAWLRRHPDTTVMRPEPETARRTGYRYVEGAADRARSGVEFPVWRQSDALERNARIYALRIGGKAKAYPMEKLRTERLVNDTLGGVPIVLVLDEESGAIRAYERGSLIFRPPAEGTLREIQAKDGSRWMIAEPGLAPEAGGELLSRIAGHVAFWFGWYAFYPDTEVY